MAQPLLLLPAGLMSQPVEDLETVRQMVRSATTVGFSLERVFDVSHGGAAARRAAAGRTVALDAYVLCPRVRYLDESVLSC